MLFTLAKQYLHVYLQSRTPQSIKNGRVGGQYRHSKYRNNENIQGNINRSMVTSETNEELVPMINATQFEDDESEGK